MKHACVFLAEPLIAAAPPTLADDMLNAVARRRVMDIPCGTFDVEACVVVPVSRVPLPVAWTADDVELNGSGAENADVTAPRVAGTLH